MPSEIPDDLEAFLNSKIEEVNDENGEVTGVTFEPSDDQLVSWEELFGSLNEQELTGIVPVSTLTDVQLVEKYNGVKEELLQRGEALAQKSQTGRDLQSERTAYLIEMRRRGLR